MERAGLVGRQTHERDRRANSLRLLATGRRKYEEAREQAVQLQTEILSTLPEHMRDSFLEHLDLVANACRHALENSPRQKQRRK